MILICALWRSYLRWRNWGRCLSQMEVWNCYLPRAGTAADDTEVMPLLQTSVDAEQDKVAEDIFAQQKNLLDK